MNNFLTTINDVITDGKNSGILHLNVSNEILEGNMLKINDEEKIYQELLDLYESLLR